MNEIYKIKEAIQLRTSIRTFDGTAISKNDEDKIMEYLNNPFNLKGIMGTSIRIHYLTGSHEEFKAVGTYGVIKNAPAYLALSCMNTKQQMIDCGFVGENLVLFLTSIGIGSCWLGGTFKRQQLSLKTPLNKNEFIPILIPIGYENTKKTFTDRAIRRIAKSHSRAPIETRFFDGSFDRPVDREEAMEEFEYIRLAPSASNKQPWRVVEQTARVDFYLRRTPNYGGERLGYDIQMIDMGIVMAHYAILAAEKQGVKEYNAVDEIIKVIDCVDRVEGSPVHSPSEDDLMFVLGFSKA